MDQELPPLSQRRIIRRLGESSDPAKTIKSSILGKSGTKRRSKSSSSSSSSESPDFRVILNSSSVVAGNKQRSFFNEPETDGIFAPNLASVPRVNIQDVAATHSESSSKNPLFPRDHKQQAVPEPKNALDCIDARTILLVPFQFAKPGEEKLSQYVNSLLSRRLRTQTENWFHLWETDEISMTEELATLNRGFLSQLGVQDLSIPVNDEIQRLKLSLSAQTQVFAKPTLSVNDADGGTITHRPTLDIALVLWQGSGLLQVKVTWKASPKEPLSLDDLCIWLYVAKFRHKRPELFHGWSFGPTSNFEIQENPHQTEFGPRFCESLTTGKPVSLSELTLWLAEAGEVSISLPVVTYHHTSVMMSQAMSVSTLNEYLFYLRRAKGQVNRPPAPRVGSVDRILQPRQNRFIGISREGVASICWPLQPTSHGDLTPSSPRVRKKLDTERSSWPEQFMGVYLLLTLHVIGEKTMLWELSNLSASCSDLLKLVLAMSASGSSKAFSEISRARKELLKIVGLVAKYTLNMSHDECGGFTDHIEFFTALRRVFNVKNQRKELTTEVHDVLAIIESTFYQEQRVAKKMDRKRERERDKRRLVLDLVIGLISLGILPFVLASGIYGMNNKDLPETDFRKVMIGAGIASGSVLLLFILFQIFFVFEAHKKCSKYYCSGKSKRF